MAVTNTMATALQEQGSVGRILDWTMLILAPALGVVGVFLVAAYLINSVVILSLVILFARWSLVWSATQHDCQSSDQ
jgi:hypothetical protein